jgi:hypothetical protein
VVNLPSLHWYARFGLGAASCKDEQIVMETEGIGRYPTTL